MSYAVVHFLTTDEIAVASSTWIKENKICKWPPIRNAIRLKRAVLEHRVPDDTWTNCEVFVMGNYENYITAKKLSDLASDTSSLETECSVTESQNKRKRKSRTYESSDSSDSEQERGYSNKTHVYSPPIIFIKSEDTNPGSNTPTCSMVCNANSESPAPPSNVALQYADVEAELTKSEVYVIKLLEDIKSTLAEHSKLLKGLEKQKADVIGMIDLMPKLPVENPAELQEWEMFLRDVDSFNTAVKYFSCKVGADANQSTRRLLSSMITNEFAQEYNWAGRPPKKKFKDLKTVSLILCAIKEHPLLRHVPGNIVEDVIKDWLKHATFRANYVPKSKTV